MEAVLHGVKLPEAMRHIGTLGQCARIDRFISDDGPARGSRVLRLVTGGGLTLEVFPDRAMDIGQVEVHGMPVAWMSPTGMAHPGLCDANGDRFLRTFGGGFLLTAGLDHFGAPCVDAGQSFGQHGRVNTVPASVTQLRVDADGLLIEGVISQAAVNQEHLQLHRRIHAPMGKTTFTITDTVTNLGPQQQPHMIMYHCNFGWPLLSESSVVNIDASRIDPFTPEAHKEAFDVLGEPTRGYKERCYLHHLAGKQSTVTLQNPQNGLKMAMTVDTDSLPGLCQWKMLGENSYVLGLEPTNTLCLGGRAEARRTGQLKVLEPQQQVQYKLHFSLSAPAREQPPQK